MGRQFQVGVVVVFIVFSIAMILMIVLNLRLQYSLNFIQNEFSRILNSTQPIDDHRQKWTTLKRNVNQLSRKTDIFNRSIETLKRKVRRKNDGFLPAVAHLWLDWEKTRAGDGTLLWKSSREKDGVHFVNGGINSKRDGNITVAYHGVYLFHGHICFDTFLNPLNKSSLIRTSIRIYQRNQFTEALIDMVKVKRRSYLSTCFVGSRKLAAGSKFSFTFKSKASTQYIADGTSFTCNSLTVVRVG